VPVAHACNPGYSGGSDQNDCGLKPAQANSSVRPHLKKPFTKIGLVEWLKVKALSSNPSTAKKKKKKKENISNSPVHQAYIIKVDTIKNKQADISILESSFL
jgi:hypothetical protein